MLHSLHLVFNKDISLISSGIFRCAIISMTDHLEDEIKDKINFHITNDIFTDITRKIPYILFAKPYKNKFCIYGYDDIGKEILKQIQYSLKHIFKLQGVEYQVAKSYLKEERYVPTRANKSITYKTITPLMLFRHNRRKVFDGIIFHNDDLKKRDIEFKKVVNDFIIKNIRYQMQVLFKDKEYKVFDEIKIEWSEFKIIMIEHKDRKEPVVVGKFNCDWELPRFIGSRVGIGFGEIIK
jgi:hypothetical protein